MPRKPDRGIYIYNIGEALRHQNFFKALILHLWVGKEEEQFMIEDS